MYKQSTNTNRVNLYTIYLLKEVSQVYIKIGIQNNIYCKHRLGLVDTFNAYLRWKNDLVKNLNACIWLKILTLWGGSF